MRKIWPYLLVALLIGAGGLYFLANRPLKVAVIAPQSDVPLRLYGLGSVEARVLSRPGFVVGGSIATLAADAGDTVAGGQPLATLDAAEQEARVARAEAATEAASANLTKAAAAVTRAQAVLAQHEAANRRQQDLARRNVASLQRAEETQRDEDVARADLAVVEGDLAVAHAQAADAAAVLTQERVLLARHRLLAPYDARVIARLAEAGTVVKAGDPLFALIDPETLWIQAYIDEERAGQLALGQSGTIRLRSLPAREFHGEVIRIGLESDRVNEERRVWLRCNDCPETLYLGEQAEVRILTGTRTEALMVPELAIEGFDGHRGTVWIVQEGRLARAELAFGARDDRGRVEVVSGLPEGAQIVRQAPRGAARGRAVRIEVTP